MFFKSWLLFLLFPIAATAQWEITGIEAQLSAGIGLHQFTNNSLVFERRRGLGTASGAIQVPVMLHFQRSESRSTWMAGMGYRRDGFTMNKNNFGDAFFFIFIAPFGGRPFADTFALRQVKMAIHSLSLPLAYDYNLSRNSRNPIQFHARAMLVPALVTGRQVAITVDDLNTQVTPPSSNELALLRKAYQQAVGSFSLFFAPEIVLSTAWKPRHLAFSMSLVPFAFDLVKPTETFLKGNTYLRLQFGLVYHW